MKNIINMPGIKSKAEFVISEKFTLHAINFYIHGYGRENVGPTAVPDINIYLIAPSVRASERNSVVLDSNPTQANFL